MWFFSRKRKAEKEEAERLHRENLERIKEATKTIEKATNDIDKIPTRDITRMLFEATGGKNK